MQITTHCCSQNFGHQKQNWYKNCKCGPITYGRGLSKFGHNFLGNIAMEPEIDWAILKFKINIETLIQTAEESSILFTLPLRQGVEPGEYCADAREPAPQPGLLREQGSHTPLPRPNFHTQCHHHINNLGQE